MVAWLAHAPLPLPASAVFLALYARRGAAPRRPRPGAPGRLGHVESLGPLSPGLLAPLGLIFGLLVGFLVADVLVRPGRRRVARSAEEASALRDVDLLMAAFPARAAPVVQALLREQIDHYVDRRVAADVRRRGDDRRRACRASSEVQSDRAGPPRARPRASGSRRTASSTRRRPGAGGPPHPPGAQRVGDRPAAADGAVPRRRDDARRHGVRAGRPACAGRPCPLALLATAMALALTLLCAQAAPFAGYFAIRARPS